MLRVMENVSSVSTTLEHKNYPLSHIFGKKKGTYWESNNNKLLESTILISERDGLCVVFTGDRSLCKIYST